MIFQLSIMVFQLALMELSAEFKNNNVKILEAHVCESIMESLIIKYSVLDMMKIFSLSLLMLLYLDDGSIQLAPKRDATIVSKICIDVMRKFGTIVQTGTATKESKIKAVFFPRKLTIKRWRK